MNTAAFATSPNSLGYVDYHFTHTINGEGKTSNRFDTIINPSTGQGFAKAPLATPEQLESTVTAARAAFRGWAARSFEERAGLLNTLAAAMRARVDELSQLLTREQGKPLAVARAEILTAAQFIEATVRIPVKSQMISPSEGDRQTALHYRPLGVVAGITPWNVPVVLASHKIVQALYTGSTLVLKPSPYTPLTTLLLGEIARAILPPGVLNVISGGNEVGHMMTSHPDIDRITFTGSTATGKRIMASAADTLKRITLELGGNDPAIILDDADLDKRLPGIFASSFRLCGQVCMGIKRIYVPAHLYDTVCERLAKMAEAHPVGDGFEPGVLMGPLQNKMQFDKIVELLEETRNEPGARILAGGHVLDRPGYFVAPTVVAGLSEAARLVREEQFGPLVPVQPYTSIDEVVAYANDTEMGLSASIWTENPARASVIGARIQAGTVWINRHVNADSQVPFGGFKQSGIGREHGLLGLLSYMEPQVIDAV